MLFIGSNVDLDSTILTKMEEYLNPIKTQWNDAQYIKMNEQAGAELCQAMAKLA